VKTNAAVGACLTILAIFVLPAPRGHAQTSKPGGPPFQLMETSIDAVHLAYKTGQLTAHQLVQEYLDRISAYDQKGPALNSIITLNPKALEEADRLDAEYKKSGLVGPLHGIPLLVKDEIDTAGMPTTLGSVLFRDYRPTLDSFVVTKLKKAGAIILGKTTLSEFAAGDTYGSLFGATRNPYDLERTVGGSSGGSGAAVAANFSTVAVGEETFASIRRPGAWNDIVSMRPTSGLVSRSGMYDGYPTASSSMGPMARSVRDLAELLDVMVGYDAEDPQTALGVGHTPESYTKFLDSNGLKGARVGILRESIGVGSEPGSEDFKKVDSVFERNVAELKSAGAVVIDPIVIPRLKELLAKRADNPAISAEALKAWLARNPTSPYKTRQDIQNSPDVDKIFPPTKAAQWKVVPEVDLARYGEYLLAREQLLINILKVMADNRLDAIIHKSVEHQPTLIHDGMNPPYPSNKGVPVLNTFLVYVPSITVPSGFTADQLPVGITFLGRPYSEPSILRLAYSYEQATHHRVPPKTTPPLPNNGRSAQASSANDGKVALQSEDTVPKDVFPDSRNRLPLIKRESLDEHGRKAYDDAVALSNSSVGTPQGVAAILLHSSGVDVRWAAPLGRRMTELAILTTARERDQPYEWSLHEMEAVAVGLDPAIIELVRHHKPLTGVGEREATVVQLGREITGKHKLSPQTYAHALKLLGESNLVDIISLMAQYAATATRLTAFNQQMPPTMKQFLPLPFSPPDDIHPDSRSRLPLIKTQAQAPAILYSRELAPTGTGPGQIRLHQGSRKSLESHVGQRVMELAILVTAREHDQQYDWTMNELAARKAGLEETIIETVRDLKPLTSLAEKEAAVIQLGRELFGKHMVTAETYARALKTFGETDLVDLVDLMAEHSADATLLTAFDQQLPAGQKALLPPR
jgi:amidase